eukprot:scaffold1758_cov40-Cyclotella_meneghiniana.AAC.7
MTRNDDNGISSTKSDLPSSSSTDIQVPLSLTLATGILTTLLGFAYAKCMKLGFRFIWKTIPSYFLRGDSTNVLLNLIRKHPAVYILLMTTCGGASVAYLSSLLPKLYTAHDYVHILSRDDPVVDDVNDEKDVFPSARFIWPLMGLCLLTSLSGFSLGPEAPMVSVGSLAGASLARKYHRSTINENEAKSSLSSKSLLEKTLAYAGAAGSITGFMNLPMAGPIFALEMTSRHSGISGSAVKSWSTSIIASFVGISFIRGAMMSSIGIGGHFDYISRAAVGAVSGRELIAVGFGCGAGGAVAGTCFHTAITFIKRLIWSEKSTTKDSNTEDKFTGILRKISVALIIGVVSMWFPQTMFWGEGSLQCMIDGQCTPFSATPHGLPTAMMHWAKVNPNVPISSWFAAAQIAIAKFLAITLASAGKYPGGVIFPLLSNGASISQSLILGLSNIAPGLPNSLVSPMTVMSFMAAMLTSITRTPLATCLILAMTASGITPLSVLLPGVLLASYTSVFVSERLSRASFFEYSN